MDIPRLAQAYGLEVIDYDRPGTGLLVHNGTGLALSVMDALPELGYTLDLTGLRQPVPARLRYFLDGIAYLSPVVVGALVFFADHPQPVWDALSHVTANDGHLVVLSNEECPYGQWVREFDQLCQATRDLLSTWTARPEVAPTSPERLDRALAARTFADSPRPNAIAPGSPRGSNC